MYPFKATRFFDLQDYAHVALFNSANFVWDVVKQINSYLNSQSLGNLEGEISPHAYLINPEKISIGKGTVVEAGAYIKGPCVIGKNCQVRHGAYIRGDFIAGNDCVIGHDTEVKNAIFLNETRAGHFAYIADSIIGNDVNLGAGVKCANLKLDSSNVIIHFETQRIDTGLRKFGAIIGDRSQIGCNVVLNPGSILGKQVDCYPCINVGGCIQENQLISSLSHLHFIQK